MKRIGLLGGMSWESSAEYYRLVNEATREELGGLHSADCILRSVDFADVERLQRDGRWDDAGALLAAEAAALAAAGADLIVLCTNTMHKVADAITAAVDVPFVHIADTTADAVATEIDLLVGSSDSPVPVFDTTRLHAQRAVRLALSNQEAKAYP